MRRTSCFLYLRAGNRAKFPLMHHMAKDSLVGWAWNAGAGRMPAPGTQKEFGALPKAWSEAGAFCPKSCARQGRQG